MAALLLLFALHRENLTRFFGLVDSYSGGQKFAGSA
jgi:hypothetical protein